MALSLKACVCRPRDANEWGLFCRRRGKTWKKLGRGSKARAARRAALFPRFVQEDLDKFMRAIAKALANPEGFLQGSPLSSDGEQIPGTHFIRGPGRQWGSGETLGQVRVESVDTERGVITFRPYSPEKP